VISTRWLEKRKPHWSRLEQLLDHCTSKGFKSLTRSELQELSLLYRQIAADLAALREDRGSVHFSRYLNQLLARAHNTTFSVRVYFRITGRFRLRESCSFLTRPSIRVHTSLLWGLSQSPTE